jgi:hypothetical protein
LRGRIRTGVNHRLDSLLLLRRQLNGHSDQYLGTRGSTLSLQARIPPVMFLTFLNPA